MQQWAQVRRHAAPPSPHPLEQGWAARMRPSDGHATPGPTCAAISASAAAEVTVPAAGKPGMAPGPPGARSDRKPCRTHRQQPAGMMEPCTSRMHKQPSHLHVLEGWSPSPLFEAHLQLLVAGEVGRASVESAQHRCGVLQQRLVDGARIISVAVSCRWCSAGGMHQRQGRERWGRQLRCCGWCRHAITPAAPLPPCRGPRPPRHAARPPWLGSTHGPGMLVTPRAARSAAR